MEFFIIIGIILIYSVMISMIFKKKIEQTLPIGIVEIVLIIYILGLLNNLKLGFFIVLIITFIQIAIILYLICREKNSDNIKRYLKLIITPGLVVYIMLCVVIIYINKNRIFMNYDEFSHWGRMIKYLFVNNCFEFGENSVIIFNEYPPFTAIFQYLFLAVKNVYSEDIIITAQCILYFSLISQTMKNINWNKSIIKLIYIVPIIIFLPMIFFKNFYLEILVDGLIGIIFALILYNYFEDYDNLIFKYLKVFSGLISLCLIKTTGIFFAILAIIIFIIELLKNRKNINIKRNFYIILSIILILIIITSSWYIKIKNKTTKWDFSKYKYIENTEKNQIIINNFFNAIFTNQCITDKNLTIFISYLLLICCTIFTIKKCNKKASVKFYLIIMLIIIPIYLMFLLMTYLAIFDFWEAEQLAALDRYVSIIILSNLLLQFLIVLEHNFDFNLSYVFMIFTIILLFLPQKNIEEKYINSKKYLYESNINRQVLTQIKKYKDIFEEDDKILYVSGNSGNFYLLTVMNQYELMLNKTIESSDGNFATEKSLENKLRDGKYTYIYIYRFDDEIEKIVKNLFEDGEVKNDTLYEIIRKDDKIILKRENI